MSQEVNIEVPILKKLGLFISPSHSELGYLIKRGNLQTQCHCTACSPFGLHFQRAYKMFRQIDIGHERKRGAEDDSKVFSLKYESCH